MKEEFMESLAQQSLSTKAARNLATTTKTAPIMEAITPRWILNLMPWVQVDSGTYRVNRRKRVFKDTAKVQVEQIKGKPFVTSQALKVIPFFNHIDNAFTQEIAECFTQETLNAGASIDNGAKCNHKLYIIANGIVELQIEGTRGEKLRAGILSEGQYFGEKALSGREDNLIITAMTDCTFLILELSKLEYLKTQYPELKKALCASEEMLKYTELQGNEYGESKIFVASGHDGETEIPQTFADYELEPREYSLSAVQTILKVHTRVSELYNDPINQLKEQMRLTVEEIKERQEWELINNKDFGLLHSVAPSMCVKSKTGAPTPDDMDELIAKVWKKPGLFLAHPKAIAAFGRECTKRGVPPATVMIGGCPFLTWRGIPIIPCDKIMVDGKIKNNQCYGKTDILLMRLGEKEQGVVGLNQGNNYEQTAGVVSHFMGIDTKAVASYLLSLYFSVAVLSEDALGKLENVEVGYYYDYE